MGATISQAETLVTGFVCKYLGVVGNIRKIFTLLIHGRSSRLIFPNHRAFAQQNNHSADKIQSYLTTQLLHQR
ncbi:MAG: hypothetical protein ACI8ZV_002232, partial [Chitinophagales bacterium]